MWYYRWWIVRFNLVEMNAPDLKGFAFYEGKLGFDNEIGFAVPAQLKELTYLRDPAFGLSQADNSYRNRADNVRSSIRRAAHTGARRTRTGSAWRWPNTTACTRFRPPRCAACFRRWLPTSAAG
jgi:hypothetical protein